MGIQGLLPLLKSIQRPVELKKFAGETLGVDTYGWLHRGAISCAVELAQGRPTKKYVNYVMHRVRMVQHFGATPYMVFDGDYLPSKAETEESRHRRREESRKVGMELLKAGKPSQAHAELQKSIDITPEMARTLIEELKKIGVPYVVAPYEADAQLVYLERCGIISGIISEDSDLLVFGAKRLITKLDGHGQCIEVNRRDFSACREISLTGWTDDRFRQMSILGGCDYLERLRKVGLKTAYRLLQKHKTPENVVRMLQFDGKSTIPSNYLTLFRQAELTFKYQRVFCPDAQEQVHLTPLPDDINVDDMPFIGAYVEPRMARKIASGEVNPMTKEMIKIVSSPSPSSRKRAASSIHSTPVASSARNRPPAGKPIDSYFKGDRRIPLGEMDTNCFSVDTQRVANMTRDGQRPIVFPLPRPYVDNSPLQPARTRHYKTLARSSSTPHLRHASQPITDMLQSQGLRPSTNVQSRGEAISQNQKTRDNYEGGDATNDRPSKKARRCDEDTSLSALANGERSKFFPVDLSKANVPKRRSDSFLMSDDSIEEAIRELPDFNGWHTSQKSETISVFEREPNPGETGDDCVDSFTTTSVENFASVKASETLSHPTIGQFVFQPTTNHAVNSNTASRRNSLIRTSPPSIISTTRSTPLSTASVGIVSTKSTPATPLMTPLQRLGSLALKSNRQRSTPNFEAPQPTKRPIKGRHSLDHLPVNPTFVPLPPCDLDEVEALHQPAGSEDMLMSESEHEDDKDGSDDQENLGRKKGTIGSGVKKLDLSQYLFA